MNDDYLWEGRGQPEADGHSAVALDSADRGDRQRVAGPVPGPAVP